MLTIPWLMPAILGAVGGLLVGWLWQQRSRQQAMLWQEQVQSKTELLQQSEQQQHYLQQQLTEVAQRLHLCQEELQQQQQDQLEHQTHYGRLQQQVAGVKAIEQEKNYWQQQSQELQHSNAELKAQLQTQSATAHEQYQAQQEKLALLENAEQRLQQQFEQLANRIFEQKTAGFAEHNKQGLDAILGPLKQQIDGFKRQVSDHYVKEGQERASLKTEIQQLMNLNLQITQEAAALTKALKGDNKQQGNWGEVILERVLSESGLREGHEYQTQGQYRDASGRLFMPDVVVHLPQGKDVIIDSKVSLNAYEQYFNCEDDTQRQAFLQEHINSLRGHIKGLGKKDYHGLEGLRSLDYVLMFVPIEPAFLLAMDHAPDLVKLAMDNNIMLVSPTNLLVALRTIHNIWQYEYQNRHAQDIAKQAGDLYDKFHGLVTDMEKLGDNINTLQNRYSEACKKLYTGRGNLVKKVESLRQLGVQGKKHLDEKTLLKADEADADIRPDLPAGE